MANSQINRDQIIIRIKKLKLHAESAKNMGSLEEAEAFMRKVNELLLEYNVSMMEVNESNVQEDKFKNWGYAESISYDDKHQGWEWKMDLMRVLTTYNLTSFTFNDNSKTMKVYGNMENVDVTVWLYHYLETGLFNLAYDHYKKELDRLNKVDKAAARHLSKVEVYRYKRDFLLGAIRGFRTQLELQRQANSQVNALIVYNDKALTEYMYKTFPNVRTVNVKNPTMKHYDAYGQGIKTGEQFKVNKPISNPGSSGSQTKKLN